MDRVRTKQAVQQRRGPVTTTRHEARQTYASKPSTRRNGGSARPDSDTTVQYAPGAGTRPLLETELTFGVTKGLGVGMSPHRIGGKIPKLPPKKHQKNHKNFIYFGNFGFDQI